MVGAEGFVTGVDMRLDMLKRSRSTANRPGLTNVQFREGLIERLRIENGWADVVICVINLVPDKLGVFREIFQY